MMDLSIITQDVLNSQLKSLSDDKKAFLISDEVEHAVANIADFYDFDEEETEILKQIVAILIIGILPRDELRGALKEEIDLDDDIATFVEGAIKQEVLTAVEREPSVGQAPTSPPVYQGGSVAPQAPPAPAPLTKGDEAPKPPTPAPTPFLLHDHTEERVAPMAAQPSRPMAKPAFVRPEFDARLKTQTSSAPARPGFGGIKIKPDQKESTMRVVNYSAPKMSASAPKTSDLKKPSGVDPANVIDLKDLPK